MAIAAPVPVRPGTTEQQEKPGIGQGAAFRLARIRAGKGKPALIAVLGLFLALALARPGWPQALVRDLGMEVIEGAWTSITLTSERTGLIKARCADCRDAPTLLLSVDPQSTILLNREPVTFARAASVSGGHRGVLYDPRSMRLVVLSIISAP